MPTIKKSQSKEYGTSSVVISSRIRLARNVAGEKFVHAADSETLARVFDLCSSAIAKTRKMASGAFYKISEMSASEKALLLEERKIGLEMIDATVSPRGLWLSIDGKCGAMINEEDHLRIYAVGSGACLPSLWRTIDAFDNAIEKCVEYSFDEKYGYLTACPTNAGTGMRASIMMHLPALSYSENMDKIVRGVNQLGMTFRGAFGEGSEPCGAIFQLSNQQTLGASECVLAGKISEYAKKIEGFENDARLKFVEDSPLFLADKFLRARAILSCCRMIDTDEAVDCLSALRLSAEMGYLPEPDAVKKIDAMTTAVRPAHIEKMFGLPQNSSLRDAARAKYLRAKISAFEQLRIESLLKRG